MSVGHTVSIHKFLAVIYEMLLLNTFNKDMNERQDILEFNK